MDPVPSTAYWKESWGFCLPHERLEELPEGDYDVLVDATLEDGSLTYGELLLEGDSREEVLVSTHVCHPSLANDNLSAATPTASCSSPAPSAPSHGSHSTRAPSSGSATGSCSPCKHGTFPEYHSSADDLDLIRPEFLADTLDKCLAVFDVLERNATYVNLSPHGEPQLGRRGLYKAVGGEADQQAGQMAILWVLNQSDGTHSVLDIAERAQMPFDVVARAAQTLLEHDLLEEV